MLSFKTFSCVEFPEVLLVVEAATSLGAVSVKEDGVGLGASDIDAAAAAAYDLDGVPVWLLLGVDSG